MTNMFSISLFYSVKKIALQMWKAMKLHDFIHSNRQHFFRLDIVANIFALVLAKPNLFSFTAVMEGMYCQTISFASKVKNRFLCTERFYD